MDNPPGGGSSDRATPQPLPERRNALLDGGDQGDNAEELSRVKVHHRDRAEAARRPRARIAPFPRCPPLGL
jgi:hypothetical protein